MNEGNTLESTRTTRSLLIHHTPPFLTRKAHLVPKLFISLIVYIITIFSITLSKFGIKERKHLFLGQSRFCHLANIHKK